MKIHCLKLIVSVCCFLFCRDSYACPGVSAPVYLLGDGAYSPDFLEVVDVAPHPDYGLFEADLRRKRKFIVDKNRNYFHVTVFDGWVEAIFFDDRCLTTEEGVRVGDSFSRVMSVYPDAKFRLGDKPVEQGELDLLANDGKVEFWIDEDKVRDLIRDGYKVDFEDEVVRETKVHAIRIHR